MFKNKIIFLASGLTILIASNLNSISEVELFASDYVPTHKENQIAVDDYLANNVIAIMNNGNVSNSLVTSYSANFDNGAPGWSSGALSGRNTWAVRSSGGNGAGFSSNAYGVAHSGNGGMEHSYIQSPNFNMTGGGTISFSSWQCNESGYYDREHVQISYNGGQSWQTLMDYNDGFWYTQSSWQTKTLYIGQEGTSNTKIRFIYDTIDGCCGCNGGWFIDNFVAMVEQLEPNLAPIAIDQFITSNEDAVISIELTGTDDNGDALTYIIGTSPQHGELDQSSGFALDFDGNDYVSTPIGSYFGGNNPLSVEAWVNVTESSNGPIFTVTNSPPGGGWNMPFLSINGTTVYGWLWGVNGNSPVSYNTSIGWHKLSITYDPNSNPNLKFYVDGELVRTASGQYSPSGGYNYWSTYNPGARPGGVGTHLNGSIDDISLWSRVLTDSEIIANVNNTLNGNETGLEGYWDFNEGTGSTINDMSGNGNNGQISGASYISSGAINSIVYTPHPNYFGPDTFTFYVNDGIEDSEEATVSVNILPVNDLPVITSIPTLDIMEGNLYGYSIFVNDIDGDLPLINIPTKPDWLTLVQSVNTQSLSFDGIDDYLSLGNPSDFDFLLNSDFSISFSFKTHSDEHQTLLSMGDGGANYQNRLIHIYLDSGTMKAQFRGNLETNTTEVSFNYATEEYYYIIYNRDVDNTFQLWVNGELADEAIDIAGPADPFTEERPLLIGTLIGFPSSPNQEGYYYDFFNGKIDDIGIWSKVQVGSQIIHDMYGFYETGDNEINNLVGYWGFEQSYDFGDTFWDVTSNNNNGTINGALSSSDVLYHPSFLYGTPSHHDGGLDEVLINIDDGNGGFVTQSFNISIGVTHMEITGESGFRLMSSPVSGPVLGDLLEELWTQGSQGSDHEGADPNVWTFNNGWVPVEDINNDVLGAGQGFVIYLFSDTDWDGEGDLPVTIGLDAASGYTVNSTDVNISSNPDQWNLVGNPYGYDVEISKILSDNNSKFHSTVYKMDDSNPGYKTHNGYVGNIDNGLIKPFDGFWIQAGTNGDVFEFHESCMRKGHLNENGGSGRTTTDESIGSAVFTFSNGELTSSIYISFTEQGEINLDDLDAKQIMPMSPAYHLTSMFRESGKSLSINNLPSYLPNDISIEMDVMLLGTTETQYETQATQMNMTWDITSLPAGISLGLMNNFTEQTFNLYGFPSANFNIPEKGGFELPMDLMQTYPDVGQAQFTLHVYSDMASSDENINIVPDDIALHNAYPNPFNPSTTIQFDVKEMNHIKLNIYDISGRQVANLISKTMAPGNHQISWNPGTLSSGVYLIELNSGTKSLKQKVTYIK